MGGNNLMKRAENMLIFEQYQKVQEFSSLDYYVVDKIQNDKFLEDENSQYDYTNRPWAKGFASEEEAFGFADQQQNKENIEIETPEGVYGFENGWHLVFT